MKITSLTALLITGVAAAAANVGPMTQWTVTVCMESASDRYGVATLEMARFTAGTMFSEIGVQLAWHGLASCPSEALQISLSEKTPEDLRRAALAYALPYEGTHIVVFWDRIQSSARERFLVPVTAHVLAHEITHILQAVSQSETGLMKAHWDANDFNRMIVAPLPFTAPDIDLIQHGLQWRKSWRQVAAEAVS